MIKILILCSIVSVVVNNDNQPFRKFAAKSGFTATDNFGNIYTVYENQICKYSSDGRKILSYSNPFNGNISHADVKNPMRILLYYKDFNRIVFLSNKFTELGSPLELDQSGLTDIEVCCISNLGGIWLFNSQTLQLQYISEKLETVYNGTVLQHIFAGKTLKPAQLAEENEQLLLSVPGAGIIVSDKFGTFRKMIHCPGISRFQAMADNIFYFNNNYLHSLYGIDGHDSLPFDPSYKINSINVFDSQAIASNGEEILFFNLKK